MSEFPAHISDPHRIELATGLLQKEMHKLLPNTPSSAWPTIDADIAGWAEGGADYHLEGTRLQDFWDSFDAILGGVKLKPLLIASITAANVSWRREAVALSAMGAATTLDQFKELPFARGTNHRYSLRAAKTYFAEHPDVAAKQRAIIEQYSTDPAQDLYPIIVMQKGDDLRIHDGHRRSMQALLRGEQTIDAWIGHQEGDLPRDFWVPINLMMSVVRTYALLEKAGSRPDRQAFGAVLRSWFDLSEVARICYRDRILDAGTPGAAELSEGM